MSSTAIRRLVLSSMLALTLLVGSIPVVALAHTSPSTDSRFAVSDLFDIVNVNVGDLSADGRWLAATATSLRDRIGVDNYRFGDPTYVAPSLSEVLVIDTQTASTQKIFSGSAKRQVRGLRWSPDASRLAMLVLTGDLFAPMLWERTSGKLRDVEVPKGKHVPENTELRWSPDGSRLLFAMRSNEWIEKARRQFNLETKGPVVVHSSKEPFLAWDDLRRMSLTRSLAAFDLKTGQINEILPEMKLRSYELSEDGTFISYQDDITKKTDYDVIG
ncbi:MAG TPA: hypothetical protein VG778_00130, partial [Blastocatellia bacterium]|nr:hypothetical protein [Blastocatellia bacterium]